MMDEARKRFEEWATESGWVLSRNQDGSYCNRTTDAAWGGFMAALQAQPVQSPLTDEQIDILQEEYDCFGHVDAPRLHDFARAIESALKGKP